MEQKSRTGEMAKPTSTDIPMGYQQVLNGIRSGKTTSKVQWRESLDQVATRSKCALLFGAGGGSDIFNTIPVMNHLRRLGVERFVLGNFAVNWYKKEGMMSFGGAVIPLTDYHPIELLNEYVGVNSTETQWKQITGDIIPTFESALTDMFDVPTVSFSIEGGLKGLLAGIEAARDRFDVDLVVGVDFGADSFYSGKEQHVSSPLIDALTLAALVDQPVPSFFILSGYGCDAELSLRELERNIGKVVAEGGFLGAFGLTPQDAMDLNRIWARQKREDLWALLDKALRGNFDTHSCKLIWNVDVGILVAIDMVFDPHVIVEKLNPLPGLLAGSKSLAEAEQVMFDMGLVSETLPPYFIPRPE